MDLRTPTAFSLIVMLNAFLYSAQSVRVPGAMGFSVGRARRKVTDDVGYGWAIVAVGAVV